MDAVVEILKGLDYSPLYVSLKTGIVATIFSFFLGLFAARRVIKAGPKVKAIADGILTLPMVLPPTAAGFFLPWLPPKSWKRQEAEERAASITFGNDDFFIAGEWEAGAVNDADYPDGFYQYLNAERDYCFKISSVGGPYSLIPHFEILGK